MGENVVENDGMLVDEAASVAAVTAGKGKWWVKSDAPTTPHFTDDTDVDHDLLAPSIEGTAVLSTGEAGATKYLREDGDGTCSWQSPAGAGDFLADGTVPMTGDFDGDGNNLSDTGVLFMREQAAADADVAGQGQLWVKTATPNELWFTDDTGVDFQLGTTLQVAAQKGSAGTISSGEVVYVSGFDSGAGVIEVELADSDNAAAMPALGIAQGTIDSTTTGIVTVTGAAVANTAGKSVGDAVYVDTTAGAWTEVRPTGTTTAIQRLGTITKVGASGTIMVAGALRSNDVPNLTDGSFWVGNGTNVATAVAMSGGATMTNAGVVTIAEIVGDTTPQLGGTLDCQGNEIQLTSGTISIDGGGTLVTLTNAGDVECEVINDGAGKAGLRADYFHINDQTAFNLKLTGTPTANRTITLPDVTGTVALEGSASHDGFSDFVAAEHVDWAGASAGTIHPTNLPKQSKTITLESPTTSDDVTMFYTEEAITVSKMVVTVVGTGTPSWTCDVHHHTSRNNAGNALITTPTASTEAANTAESVGHVITSFDDATIPALSWVWVETDAQSGTWTNGGVSVTLIYREDA